MIFGKTKMELKVGVFVFIAFIILVVFILSIGGFKTWTSHYRVNFIFNFINGVKLGAPVRFAGLDVGEVKELKFFSVPPEDKPKVCVTCTIRKEIKIPLDSNVWINTLGLLGEKYVEIIPGGNSGKCLAKNQNLNGVDPMPMHEITKLAENIASNLNDSIIRLKNKEGTVGKLLYDDALYKELEAAIKNKEGTVGKLFYNDSLYKEIEGLITDIRKHPWKLFWKTKEKK